MGGYSIFDGTLVDMTWREVEEAAARDAVALLPVGVIEEHGPHLPLGVDVYGSVVLAQLVRDGLAARDAGAVIGPPFYWGVNAVTGGFPGSFRTRPEVATELLVDVTASLREDGFDEVYVINHHGDAAHLAGVLAALSRHHASGWPGLRWLAPSRIVDRLGQSGDEPWWLVYDEQRRETSTLGVHADERETAMMMRWYPDLVRYEELEGLEPTKLGPDHLAEWRRGGDVARAITPLGYFGDPAPRDTRRWRGYLADAASMVDALVSHRPR